MGVQALKECKLKTVLLLGQYKYKAEIFKTFLVFQVIEMSFEALFQLGSSIKFRICLVVHDIPVVADIVVLFQASPQVTKQVKR